MTTNPNANETDVTTHTTGVVETMFLGLIAGMIALSGFTFGLWVITSGLMYLGAHPIPSSIYAGTISLACMVSITNELAGV